VPPPGPPPDPGDGNVPPPIDPPGAPEGYTYWYIARCNHGASYTIKIDSASAIGVIVGNTSIDAQFSTPSTSHSVSVGSGYNGVWLYVESVGAMSTSSLTINDSYALEVANLNGITGLTTFNVIDNPPLTALNLDGTSIKYLNVNGSGTDNDLSVSNVPDSIVTISAINSGWTNLGSLLPSNYELYDKPLLTTIDATGTPVRSVLVWGDTLLSSITITDFSALEQYLLSGNPLIVSLPSGLTGSSVLTRLMISNTPITSVDLTGCNNLSSFSFNNASDLVTMTVNGCTLLDVTLSHTLTSLTTFNTNNTAFDGCFALANPPQLLYIDISNCGLIIARVNEALVVMDSDGKTNGTLDIRNNSAPNGPGLTAKSNLQAKGWIVLTD